MSAVRLDADIETGFVQSVNERLVHLQTWFSASEHAHLPSLIRRVVQIQHRAHDLLSRHRRRVRKIRVTPRAAQVTSAKTNKHSGNSAVRTFTLQGKEYFVDSVPATMDTGQ